MKYLLSCESFYFVFSFMTMEIDGYYTIDLNAKSNDLYEKIRHDLITFDYVKIKCENISAANYETVCLNIIENIGGIGCPYGKDPNGLVWSVKVVALDTDPESIHLPGTNVDRELHLHTDCSFERDAPDYIGLFVIEPDRSEHGGKFQLVRTGEILSRLSSTTKQLLHDETYKFIVRPAYQKDGKDSIWLPILLNNERMRYQPDLIDRQQLNNETIEKQNAIKDLNSVIFNEEKLNIFRPKLESGMMVLFNNHRFLHGRTKIQDINRHLLRLRFNLKKY